MDPRLDHRGKRLIGLAHVFQGIEGPVGSLGVHEVGLDRLPEEEETKVGSMFQANMPGTNQLVNFVVIEDREQDRS